MKEAIFSWHRKLTEGLWRKANRIWVDWSHFMAGISKLAVSVKDDTTNRMTR